MPSDIEPEENLVSEVKVYKLLPEEREKYKPNRPTKVDLILDLKHGLKVTEIAEKWGRNVNEIRKLMAIYQIWGGGVKPTMSGEDKEGIEKLKELYDQGLGPKEIGEKLGISPQKVGILLSKHGIRKKKKSSSKRQEKKQTETEPGWKTGLTIRKCDEITGLDLIELLKGVEALIGVMQDKIFQVEIEIKEIRGG